VVPLRDADASGRPADRLDGTDYEFAPAGRAGYWNEGSAFQVRYAGRVAPPLSNVSASPQS
jgi:hypothetical protein